MKKRFVLISLLIIFLSIIFGALYISAEEAPIAAAYAWLQDQVFESNYNIRPLDSEQLAFALMAFSDNDTLRPKLVDNLTNKMFSDTNHACWCYQEASCTKTKCDITSTAKVMFALSNVKDVVSFDTTKSVQWIKDQKIISVAPGLTWFLQLDPQEQEETKFSIRYDFDVEQNEWLHEENITVGVDKKYSLEAASSGCFTIYSNYWLGVKPSCITKTFSISTNKPHKSYASLLFNTSIGNTIIWNVPQTTKEIIPASSQTIDIQIYCLGIGECSYEGTLWAASALLLSGNDDAVSFVNNLVPYLLSPLQSDKGILTSAQESSLFYIIGVSGADAYAASLLSNQVQNGYWVYPDNSKDYLGTALAAYSMKSLTRAQGNITKVKFEFNRSASTSATVDDWGFEPTSLMLYTFYPRRFLTTCEQKARAEPAKGYQCISGATAIDRYLVSNSSLSCTTSRGGVNYNFGTCYQTGTCSGGLRVCNSTQMSSNDYALDETLTCLSGFSCYVPNDCFSHSGKCLASNCNSDAIFNLPYDTYTSSCGVAGGTQRVCCQKNACESAGNSCASRTCNPATQIVSQNRAINATCGLGNACCEQNGCTRNGMECRTCNPSTEMVNITYNSSCGVGSCCMNNTCYQKGGICKLTGTNLAYEYVNNSLECIGGMSCYQKKPCGEGTQQNCGTCNLLEQFSNQNFFCLSGSCCQNTTCFLEGWVCKQTGANRADEVANSTLSDCSSGRTCYQESPCTIAGNRCPGTNSCNLDTEINNSLQCGRGTCCQNTTCALLGGICKAKGELNEVENAELSKSCSSGRKCFQPSPCSIRNLTCYDEKCPSGMVEKKSAKYPDRYKCNTGAVCCEPASPPACSYNCLSAACENPLVELGGFACAENKFCCKMLDNACTSNKGYSCKAQCASGETSAPGLACPATEGACCKPNYQCLAANDTCRQGTSASCLSGEKYVNLSCQDGYSCCEKIPEDQCTPHEGKCKNACAANEETLTSYKCPTSGLCCREKKIVLTCSTLDDCYNKKECDKKSVTDIFGVLGKCEYGKELSCSDNFDNDGDGFIDEEDPDCPKTCSHQGYICCDECATGHARSSYDSSCKNMKCCDKCKVPEVVEPKVETKSKTWLWIVLGVMVVGIAAASYFLFLRKPGKKSAAIGGIFGGMPSFRPPVKPYMPPVSQRMPARPYQPQQQSIQLRQPELRPKLTKTEEDLEETLKKLKKMSEK